MSDLGCCRAGTTTPDYVSGSKYLEYLAPSDAEILVEDKPLPADTSPTALSLGYVVDSDPLKEDPEENLEQDPADYPTDGGDDEEESSEDDDDEEEDEDKEDEHLAPTDFVVLPTIDPVPSAEEREPFETDEARIAIRPHTPPSPSTEALIAEYASAPTPASPPPSPLSQLSSLLPKIPSSLLLLLSLHTSPTYASASLGYRAAMV
nr:hypothetical protein [Tanacetum cinerariifolium]